MQQIFICPKCGTQNSLSQQFCVGCGAPLATFCPYCGANISPASRFCVNCGAQLDWDAQKPVTERKSTSGWAKFGKVMLILGILCIVVGPIVLLIMPSSEFTAMFMIRILLAGVFNIIVGLSLMRKG